MTFEDTYTEKDFERALSDANEDLFAGGGPAEPDLKVEGLSGSLMSRLLALFKRE